MIIIAPDLPAVRQYCVGVRLYGGKLHPWLMHCKELCEGTKPCFNTCCRPGEAYDDKTMCRTMSENLTNFFLSDHEAFEDFRGITMDNFAKAPSFMLTCPPGYEKNHRLKPDIRDSIQ